MKIALFSLVLAASNLAAVHLAYYHVQQRCAVKGSVDVLFSTITCQVQK